MKSYLEELHELKKMAQLSPTIKLGQILNQFAGHGSPLLVILFSLPSITPVPGVSAVFGIVLAFLGLKILLHWHRSWPDWMTEKTLQSEKVCHIIEHTEKVLLKMRKLFKPRLCFMLENRFLYRLSGLVIFLCSILLATPIPLTNLFTAMPILCIGIGLLYHDGLLILLGECFALIVFGLFIELLRAI